jgi:lysophospholipase L1-like esterase
MLLGGACASSTTAPTPGPEPDPLTISCPAAAVANSLDGNAVAISFADATARGGTAPVTTTCAPASGSSFPVGTNAVTCTARDAKQVSATCSFSVTVSKVPRLSVTNIDAFGDSMTEGGVSACNSLTATPSVRPAWDLVRFATIADVSRSYPTRLQQMLRAAYPAQNITVANDGRSGELTGEGVDRLVRTVLPQRRPEVLLLQEGANDINQEVGRGTIVTNLRDMARKARDSGVHVFIGTLLPMREGSCKGYQPDRIPSTNDMLRAMAAAEGFPIVDLWAAFGGSAGSLIGPDGLHPNDAGYEKMAETFSAALRQRFEN